MAKLIVRGLQVNIRTWNEHAEETLVLLHGFTGSVATWEKVANYLPTTFRIIAIDLIGHGDTAVPAEVSRYLMTEQVKDLEDLFTQLNLESFTLLGYSMGGRIALCYTVAHAHRVKRLILESSSPGLKTAEERQARRQADEVLADKIERNGVISFVDKWQDIPLFASQKNLPSTMQHAIRQERLSQSAQGLANSLRGMGTGAQVSVWEELGKLRVPVLLVTGSLDDKFCRIAEQMLSLLPNAQHIEVSEVGHAIHVENPVQFATIVK